MVPAKYPLKVKLELFTTLECQTWGKLCVTWFVRVLGFLFDISSLAQKSFPYGSPHERILWNPFLVRVLLISIECEAQNISLYMHAWRPN